MTLYRLNPLLCCRHALPTPQKYPSGMKNTTLLEDISKRLTAAERSISLPELTARVRSKPRIRPSLVQPTLYFPINALRVPELLISSSRSSVYLTGLLTLKMKKKTLLKSIIMKLSGDQHKTTLQIKVKEYCNDAPPAMDSKRRQIKGM